jgi:hypothetical protein
MKAAIVAFATLFVTACSSSSPPASPGTNVDAGKDGSTSSGPCPTSVPAAGVACAREGLVCEYGEDKVFACTTHALCASGKFQILGPNTNAQICPSAAVCPRDPNQAQGVACANGASCYPGSKACKCAPVVEDPPNPNPRYTWGCDESLPMEGCTNARPKVGTTCSAKGPLDPVGGSCFYVDCNLECRDSVWQPDRECSARFGF